MVHTTTSRRARRWARGTVRTAGGGWFGGRASDPALSGRPALSVTVEMVCGSGDGDDAAMVQPVVIGADQHQVGQLGGAAVFPVPDVVGVQTAGGATTGNRAGAVAVLQRAAQPAADQPGRPAGADDLAVTFEPDFAGGITGQVSAFGLGEQRTQMQRRDARSLTSRCITTVVCCPWGRRAASASHPASTSRMNASTVPGNGGALI